MAYRFRTLPSGLHHELALLSLVSRGQVTGAGHVRLQPYPASPELALSDLLENRSGFVGAHHVCIEAGRFVIYFGMPCSFFLDIHVLIFPIAANAPSCVRGGRRYGHTHLARLFQQAFPHDNTFLPLPAQVDLASDSEGSDDEAATDSEESASVAASLVPAIDQTREPDSIPSVGSLSLYCTCDV
jgi:hypothetical protein